MISEDDYVSGNPKVSGSPLMVVLTGCSGSGKSSLLAELAQRGNAVMPEAGRQIVREQIHIGGRALPWKDACAFVELSVSRAMHQFNTVRPDGRPAIFDRSIIDLVSYLDHKHLPVPPHLRAALAAYRYGRRVLVTPPWREIHTDDGERMKTFDAAVSEYCTLVRWYVNEGYELVEIPRTDTPSRANFCESFFRQLVSRD